MKLPQMLALIVGLSVLLTACPDQTKPSPDPTITALEASANPTTLNSAATSSLTATVSGTGAFDPGVNWSVLSGGGTLSANTGSSVTYTAPNVASDTSVQIKAEAAGNYSIFKTLQLTVKAATPTPGLTINKFTATPTSLTAPGEVTLEWDVSGATQLELGGAAVTPLTQGSQKVSVTKTTTFTLKASNGSGTSSKSVDVTVGAAGLQPGVWDSSNWNEATWQ